MYDSFDSLPDYLKARINTLIQPPDAEAWVKTPIPALDGRSFLEVINSDDGDLAATNYFESVEAFERPEPQFGAEDLGRALRFDQADLDSNRAGLLSASQRTRLLRSDLLKMLGAAVCLIAGVIFNIALLAGWTTIHGRGAALGVTLILLGLILAVWSAETWLDLGPGSVLVVDGHVRSTERAAGRYGEITIYGLEVGNQTFNVPKAAHDALREGNLRLYYLRRTRTVLSVESSRNTG